MLGAVGVLLLVFVIEICSIATGITYPAIVPVSKAVVA